MHETLRAFAAQLPDVTERRSRTDRATELVTNRRCFVSLPDAEPDIMHAVTTEDDLARLLAQGGTTFDRSPGLRGSWVRVSLGAVGVRDLEHLVLDAWRLRSGKWAQWAYLHPRFVADIEPILAELRSWPELTEGRMEHFAVGAKPFLHFHCGWTGHRADVKLGDTWGPPIPIPVGQPSADAVASILTEMRRRLDVTLAPSSS